jgi:hypothetical protein
MLPNLKTANLETERGMTFEHVAANKALARPNILFCITDNQSARHAGAYGDEAVAEHMTTWAIGFCLPIRLSQPRPKV